MNQAPPDHRLLPEDFVERVFRAVDRQRRSRRLGRSFGIAASAVAVLALVGRARPPVATPPPPSALVAAADVKALENLDLSGEEDSDADPGAFVFPDAWFPAETSDDAEGVLTETF